MSTNEIVQDYYGKTLETSADLKTNACCTAASMPQHLKDALSNVHDEVLAKYYGCGLIAPPVLGGASVLDLGSGSGRDCYVLSQWVGEAGKIVGVDMTDEQLAVANAHIDFHTKQFGFSESNISFLKGYIEQLDKLDLEPESFDVVISNCVINLATDKSAVLREVYNLLKNGGEMYFSDVYASKRVTKSLREDPVLYGECLSGALYWNDFINLAKSVGFLDPRLVEVERLSVENSEIEAKLSGYEFYSATFRLFKTENLEASQEDYGCSVTYLGSIEHHPEELLFDEQLTFPAHQPCAVSGNTWRMLKQSRFAEHFEFNGSLCCHSGAFGTSSESIALPQNMNAKPSSSGCC